MKHLFIFILIVMNQALWAAPFLNEFDGVRPTGMGNAFIALADDANALWYNPAGLAQIEGAHVNVFNFILGADSSDTLNRIKNALFKGDSDHLVREDKQFLRFNFLPSFIAPHFGVSLFSQTRGYFDLSDLENSGLQAHAFHDQGLIAGGAVSLNDYLSLGISVRAFYRASVELDLTAQEIIDQYGLDALNLVDNIYQELSNRAGHGYGFGLNAGLRIKVPIKSSGKTGPSLFLAATAEDIGNTTFRAMGDSLAPTPIQQSLNFGSALIYPFSKRWQWSFTADVRRVLEPTDVIKLLHLGTELKHSVFGIRAGANQGYLAYGFSIEFPPHTRLHFSSYGVELGNKRWEKEQRWYLLQLNIGFNPN